MCGALLVLAGHAALRAAAAGDHPLLGIMGRYGLVSSVVGIAAFPASPLWLLLVSSLLIAAGRGPSAARSAADAQAEVGSASRQHAEP